MPTQPEILRNPLLKVRALLRDWVSEAVEHSPTRTICEKLIQFNVSVREHLLNEASAFGLKPSRQPLAKGDPEYDRHNLRLDG